MHNITLHTPSLGAGAGERPGRHGCQQQGQASVPAGRWAGLLTNDRAFLSSRIEQCHRGGPVPPNFWSHECARHLLASHEVPEWCAANVKPWTCVVASMCALSAVHSHSACYVVPCLYQTLVNTTTPKRELKLRAGARGLEERSNLCPATITAGSSRCEAASRIKILQQRTLPDQDPIGRTWWASRDTLCPPA